jgi:hypothetical protein
MGIPELEWCGYLGISGLGGKGARACGARTLVRRKKDPSRVFDLAAAFEAERQDPEATDRAVS